MNMLNIELARELQRDRDRLVAQSRRAQPDAPRVHASRSVMRGGVAAVRAVIRNARRWLVHNP